VKKKDLMPISISALKWIMIPHAAPTIWARVQNKVFWSFVYTTKVQTFEFIANCGNELTTCVSCVGGSDGVPIGNFCHDTLI
jgi:hypothetical protein